jgi:hypothetical protein
MWRILQMLCKGIRELQGAALFEEMTVAQLVEKFSTFY